MGLFFPFFYLSGTGINQEVSGGHWIWVVVLFTDDWLASQNHQIHLPTVTFITVIFKVTATCLVSQRWPPRVHSHLLPFPPLPSSSFTLSLFSTPIVVPPHHASPCTYSPLLLHLTTFVWLSICPRVLPHSARQVEGSRVREVWREAERRGEKRTKWDPPPHPSSSPPHPPTFPPYCLKGVFRIPILFTLQWRQEIHLRRPSCCLALENCSSSSPADECKWKVSARGALVTSTHAPAIIYFKTVSSKFEG